VLSSLFRRNKIIGHLDTIVDCTDKLLNRWRTQNNNPTYIHLNMVEQTQHLLLAIFGFIGSDYDLQLLSDEDGHSKNDLTHAIHTHLNTTVIFAQLPTVIGRVYLFFNVRY
jgi:hypothetical protein